MDYVKKEDMRSLLFHFFVVFISVLLRWVIHGSVTVTVPHFFFMIAVGSFPFVFCLVISTATVYGLKMPLETTVRNRKILSRQSFTKNFHLDPRSVVVTRSSSAFLQLSFYFPSSFFFFSWTKLYDFPKQPLATASLDPEEKIKGLKKHIWKPTRSVYIICFWIKLTLLLQNCIETSTDSVCCCFWPGLYFP